MAGYEAYHRFSAVFFYPMSSFGFHAAAYFAYHDDAVSLRVIHQQFYSLFCSGADDRAAGEIQIAVSVEQLVPHELVGVAQPAGVKHAIAADQGHHRGRAQPPRGAARLRRRNHEAGPIEHLELLRVELGTLPIVHRRGHGGQNSRVERAA